MDSKIEQEILKIQGLFEEDDVYHIIEHKHNITDRNKILGILNRLCDEGKLEYGQVSLNNWVYSVVEE